MSQAQNNGTGNETRKSAIERLEELEGKIARIEQFAAVTNALYQGQQGMGNTLKSIKDALENVAKGLDATLGTLDSKGIATFAEIMATRSAQESDRIKKTEDSLLSGGSYTEGLEVTEGSLLAVKQSSKDGTVMVDRALLDLSKLQENVRSSFSGKSVGAVVSVDESSVEILRVLNPVEQGSKSELSSESSEVNSEAAVTDGNEGSEKAE